MKRLIFILLLSAIHLSGFGQKKPQQFTLSTSIGTGIAIDSPSQTPLLWQLCGYYNVSRRFSIGAGTGISVYEKILLPLFADAKFRLTKPHLFTPYLNCGIGYSVALSTDCNGGFLFSPGIGTEIPIYKKMKLFVSIGYEYQRLERIKKHKGEYFSAEFSEELRHNSITFKAGITF